MTGVSLVVAVRDGAAYVAGALESALQQTHRLDEIVVIDDGSEDATPQIIESFGSRVRVERQPPTGYAAAINRGVARSTSAWITFLDADDLWPLNSVEARLQGVGDTSVDAVCGRLEQFVSPELEPEEAARFRFDAEPKQTELLNTMIVRRRFFDRVGPLDESLTTGANIDWISRARAHGMRVVHVDDTVYRRRLHRTNVGVRLAATERKLLPGIVRAHVRRMTSPQPKGDQ